MSGAVGHKRVNKDFIEETLIPIPSADEQKKKLITINGLSNNSKIIKEIAIKKIKEINSLKQSILKKFLNAENNKSSMNEAETRAELIDPKIKEAGWGDVEGSFVRREFKITNGEIKPGGIRAGIIRADYVLII